VCVCQSVKVLDDEENADKQLRTSHGARWTRTPSERLTESIRAEAARYRQIIDNAVTADGIVRQRYAQHRDGFELLSRSDVSVCYSVVYWTLQHSSDNDCGEVTSECGCWLVRVNWSR